MRSYHRTLWAAVLLALCLTPVLVLAQSSGGSRLWLPVTIGGAGGPTQPPASPTPPPATPVLPPPSNGRGYPRIHIPQFGGEVAWEETSVFWFGAVTPDTNSVDARVGYTDEALVVRLSIYDRLLWYDTSPSAADLAEWDAATLYLDLNAEADSVPGGGTYRLVGQLSWWEDRGSYQATYYGSDGAWQPGDLGATSEAVYRGDDAPNSGGEARGWVLTWRIPFSGLGLSSHPAGGAQWGLGIAVHDRDAASEEAYPEAVWPHGMDPADPRTWGTLSFGLSADASPTAAVGGTATIRHGLSGAIVPDGHVGGGTVCGEGLDIWREWGETNYAGAMAVNVQNQADVADWPCFSRYYVTFPLDAVPAGKAVLSATLTLRQMGSSSPDEAEPSLIQAFTVLDDWDEATLTWNNAPQARENLSRTWVDPMAFPGDWAALPARNWDVTRAVADARDAGEPLRLALYSADSAYHSGRYFVPSDTEDWNAANRPTLTVTWGE